MLTAMVLGSITAFVLNQALGAERTGLRTLGPLPGALPPLSFPDVSAATLQSLLPGAIAVALVSLTQALSIAHAIALKSGQRLDNNQEFIAQVLPTSPRPFFSGFPTSASANRCGINYDAARRRRCRRYSRRCSWCWCCSRLRAGRLPADPRSWRGSFSSSLEPDRLSARPENPLHQPGESAVLAVTFFATLLLDLEFAIFVGVLVSLVLFLNRTSHPIMRSLVPDPRHTGRKMTEVEDGLLECPQLKILRIEARSISARSATSSGTSTRCASTAPGRNTCS